MLAAHASLCRCNTVLHQLLSHVFNCASIVFTLSVFKLASCAHKMCRKSDYNLYRLHSICDVSLPQCSAHGEQRIVLCLCLQVC